VTEYFNTREAAERYCATVLGGWIAPVPAIPGAWMVIHP
jgi:hypothetical protein